MGPIDSQALKSLYEQGGDEALIQWVRGQRDGLLMEDATEQQVHRRLDLLDKGVWQLDEGWLDLARPQIYDIAKSYVFNAQRTRENLSKGLRELLTFMLDDDNAPRRSGHPVSASSPKNITVAIHCIDNLVKIGLVAYCNRRDKHDGTPMAVEIVAHALGVSKSSVRNWWSAKERFRKNWVQ